MMKHKKLGSTSLKSEDTTTDSTLAVFKYDRDNMYSELSENYNNVIKNEKSNSIYIKIMVYLLQAFKLNI